MGLKGQRILLKQQFDGLPKPEDFVLINEDLGALNDGEIYYQAEYISVDPYQRAFASMLSPPVTMIGRQVAKVLESKDADYPAGTRIVIFSGWVKLGKINPKEAQKDPSFRIYKAPELKGISPANLLGACGMPGMSAYFGLLELCQPKVGETVLVNGAAGAVGSLVGQIAKIKGCKVIGYAGTDEKVAWLKELGFDHVYNYKKITMRESLKIAAPKGIDCFFDNVGGADSAVVLEKMNTFGRIAQCGSISTYNVKEQPLVPAMQWAFVGKQLRMEGFLVMRWFDRRHEAIEAMTKWISEGKIKARETIVEGFENTPKALIGTLTGKNMGKMVVKC